MYLISRCLLEFEPLCLLKTISATYCHRQRSITALALRCNIKSSVSVFAIVAVAVPDTGTGAVTGSLVSLFGWLTWRRMRKISLPFFSMERDFETFATLALN